MLLRTLHFTLFFLLILGYITAHENKDFTLLSVDTLRNHVFAHNDHFFCALIRGVENDPKALEMENLLQDPKFESIVLGSVTNSSELTKLTKVKSDQELPFLRCFFACPKYKDYLDSVSRSSVLKWIKRMMKRHKQLMSKEVKNIQESIVINEVTIMAAPFLEQVINIQNVLHKVKSKIQNHCSISILFVHPNSRSKRTIQSFYGIPQKTSVVVFTNTDKSKEPEKTIFTGQNIDSIQINSHILSRLTRVKHLTSKTFQHEAMTVKTSERFQPHIVAFYAWWAKHSQSFLACFKTTVEHFRENSVLAKFALVNAAEEKGVIQAFLQFKKYKSPPFIVVFQRETGKYTVNQTLLDISHPSPFHLHKSLDSIGLSLEDVWGKSWSYSPYKTLDITQYSDLKEGPFGTLCTAWAHNQTDSTFIPTQKTIDIIPEEIRPKTIEDLLPKYQGVPILTENFWDASVKKSDSNFGVYTSASKVVVTVFAFIRAGCGSCEAKMGVFRKLHKEIKKSENSKFLLVNCSLDVTLCKDMSINGYPSVVALRNFAALASPKCGIPPSEKSHVRWDYHGPIDTWPLYSWYQQLTMPSAELLEFGNVPSISKMETDVRLIATLVPKTSVYLPIARNRDKNYFYSLSCFRLACELLYGLTSCQLIYSKKIPTSEFKDKNTMVVTEIDFERKDGIFMKLMSLGKPLHSLLEEETSSSLHLFHQPHQYSIGVKQTCESNHDACTQVIVNFTRDHLRLPVTSLTSEIFHTTNNPLFESGKPVLIALGLPDNITATSNFMQVMYRVASTLYKDILVTVMNVEEYPAWAGSFVPKNYNKYFIAEDHSGPLHTYPRLCLVDWRDHRHAAFYPPLYTLMEGSRDTFNISMEKSQHSLDDVDRQLGLGDDGTGDVWDGDRLIQYIGLYLNDPSQFVVKTEHF